MGTAATVASAVRNLAWLLSGEEEQRVRDAETVLFLVLHAFLRVQDATAATAIAYQWQVEHAHAESSATRQEVRASRDALLDRLSSSQSFTEQVRALHPWRRNEAEEIRDTWPAIELTVHTIVTADDRGALLREWAEQQLTWYVEAPAEVACWLGELAADYGQPAAAARFLGDGLSRGAFPAGYWKARRAIHLLRNDPAEAMQVLKSAQEHPLARCLLAWDQELWQDAIDAIATWRPESPADNALKLQILARLTAGAGDLHSAITLALQAAEIDHAAAAAVMAAELLLSRAHYGQTIHRLADAEQAAQLAVRARNARRTWQGDSAAAALVAVKAAALAGTLARAWTLTQAPPQGDATEAEAADSRVRREAAHIASLTDRFEHARALAEAAGSPFTEAAVGARELATQGQTAEAIAAWEAALSLATDERETLMAAMSLAELGASIPDLGELEDSHPEVLDEIRLVQQAMAAGADDLEALRKGASKSPLLTINLADRHGDRGEPRMAADVLKAGAERWNDPRMMLMAARRYRESGDLEAARETAESGLALGGSHWAGEFDTRAFLCELHVTTGAWDKATQQARALVALDPHDTDARWALVHCLVRRGDLEPAWNALTQEGDPAQPRDRHDAIVWINLAARYDTNPRFVSRALQTMRRWPDDEQLGGIFIGQIYAGLRREEFTPTPENLSALHVATADYTERFPESVVFRAVPVGDDDPLGALREQVRHRHEARERIVTQVADGQLPLGMLAEATGLSYAEACIRRAAGFVRCHDPGGYAQRGATIATTLDHRVVIDTTAAHTLALLDADTRSQLIAAFGQVLTTDPAYHDVLRGHESLALRSTMWVGWDPVAGQPTVTTIEESLAEELADRAETLSAILRAAVRRPWSHLTTLQDLPRDSVWLTLLDMAATDELAYWCDDTVLAGLAASLGVPSFDTVSLLRYQAGEGRIDPDLLAVNEATLLRSYYSDLGFDRAVFDLSATMDRWRALGVAFAVTRPATWAVPSAVMAFVFSAVQHCVDASLEDLEGWITAAAVGVVRIAPDDFAAGSNLEILLGQCVTQPWMRSDRLPVVLRAVRAARDERADVADPVEPVLAKVHETLVARHGHPLAASLLLSLAQFASEQDRLTAARVVLTHAD